MPHVADIDLTAQDITSLASADAVTGLLNRLGYPTGRRQELTAEALGLTGETADAIHGIELLPESDVRILNDHQNKLRARQTELLGRQLELEMQLEALVQEAYGLSPEERQVVADTRPPRDPQDVLRSKIGETCEPSSSQQEGV